MNERVGETAHANAGNARRKDDASSAPDVTAQIRSLLVDVVGVDVASPETDLIESGLLDSLAFVELLLGIERRFGVDAVLAEFELEDFRTVAGIATFVRRHAPTTG